MARGRVKQPLTVAQEEMRSWARTAQDRLYNLGVGVAVNGKNWLDTDQGLAALHDAREARRKLNAATNDFEALRLAHQIDAARGKAR